MPARLNDPGSRSTFVITDEACAGSYDVCTGAKIYEDAAALNLYRIRRDAILFEARLADAATSMKFPIVPRADDIISVEPTLTERASDMVASIRNRSEFSIFERNRDVLVHRCDALQRFRNEFIHVTNINSFSSSVIMICALNCFNSHVRLPLQPYCYAVTGRVFSDNLQGKFVKYCTRARSSSI